MSTLSALFSESDCRTPSDLHTYFATQRRRRKIKAERKGDEKVSRRRRMAAGGRVPARQRRRGSGVDGTLCRDVGGNLGENTFHASLPRHDVVLVEDAWQLVVDQQLSEKLQQTTSTNIQYIAVQPLSTVGHEIIRDCLIVKQEGQRNVFLRNMRDVANTFARWQHITTYSSKVLIYLVLFKS